MSAVYLKIELATGAEHGCCLLRYCAVEQQRVVVGHEQGSVWFPIEYVGVHSTLLVLLYIRRVAYYDVKLFTCRFVA